MSHAILAIELSTPTGQLAVVRDGQVLLEREFTSNRSHNSMLYAPLAQALEAAGTLGLIVVGTGPGSYTGVRIGIAAAHGVALSKGVPVIGIPTLAALSDEADYFVVGDARRGKFYTTQVSGGEWNGRIDLHEAAGIQAWKEAHASAPCFTSDAVVPAGLAGVTVVQPSAVRLAHLAARWNPERIAEAATRELEPLYITEAFITTAKKKVA